MAQNLPERSRSLDLLLSRSRPPRLRSRERERLSRDLDRERCLMERKFISVTTKMPTTIKGTGLVFDKEGFQYLFLRRP